MPHDRLKVIKFNNDLISKNPIPAFLSKTLKGIVGFFGVFIVFPVIIAWDCFKDNEWIWNKIELED